MNRDFTESQKSLLEAYKRRHPWTGSESEKQAKMLEFHSQMCQLLGLPVLRLVFDSSYEDSKGVRVILIIITGYE